jgi:hypothetical protein
MVDLFKKDPPKKKPKKPKLKIPAPSTFIPPPLSEAKNPDARFLGNFKNAQTNKEKLKAIFKYLQGVELLEEFIKILFSKGKKAMEDKNNEGGGFVTDMCIDSVENQARKIKERIEDSPIKEVDVDVHALLEVIVDELKAIRETNPEKQLAVTLRALDKLDKKQFILSNLLEQLKKGEDYYKILDRFNKLGLTDIELPKLKDRKPKLRDRGKALLRSMTSLKGIKKKLWQLVINFADSIPHFMELKPRLSLTAGLIPAISFDIAGKGLSVHEALHRLFKDI